MAITSVTKRKLDDYFYSKKEIKNAEGIGPGTYSPKPFEKTSVYKNMRPPAFYSQDPKWSPDKTAIKNNIPGPGAYSISGDLNKGKVVAINPEKGSYTYIIHVTENAINLYL